MNKDIINRSPRSIDREDFLRLLNLNNEFNWLQLYSDGFNELWSSATDDTQKELIEDLIRNFVYFTETDLELAARAIYKTVAEEWKLNPQKTLLASTTSKDKPDGSHMILYLIKNKFPIEWSDNAFYTKLDSTLMTIKKTTGLNVVLVDDFVGTGHTLFGRVTAFKKKVDQIGGKVNLYFATIASMEFSKVNLNQLDIQYYSYKWLRKGISELVEERKREKAKLAMINLEKKLAASIPNYKLKKYSFGYEESESLFKIGAYNVPNNVFPIFWWSKYFDNSERVPVFNRR